MSLFATATFVAGMVVGSAFAEEPNDDWAHSNVLTGPQVVVSAIDYVTFSPDTTLGMFDELGTLVAFSDDDSFFGNGQASALHHEAVNQDGSIRFAVSGFGDSDFDGLSDGTNVVHNQTGYFEAYVTVYDAQGRVNDAQTLSHTLFPGEVASFVLSDSMWVGGNCDIELNNFFGPPSDVDYWAYMGLSVGAAFKAEIVAGDFDTALGLFDDRGLLVDADDDSGVGNLSQLFGTVPLGGTIWLAVSGYPDFGFGGLHGQNGSYSLRVTIVPEPATAIIVSLVLALLSARRATQA